MEVPRNAHLSNCTLDVGSWMTLMMKVKMNLDTKVAVARRQSGHTNMANLQRGKDRNMTCSIAGHLNLLPFFLRCSFSCFFNLFSSSYSLLSPSGSLGNGCTLPLYIKYHVKAGANV